MYVFLALVITYIAVHYYYVAKYKLLIDTKIPIYT